MIKLLLLIYGLIKKKIAFPMIQSGSAHNEMLLNKDQKQDKKSAEKGKILV